MACFLEVCFIKGQDFPNFVSIMQQKNNIFYFNSIFVECLAAYGFQRNSSNWYGKILLNKLLVL